MLFADHQNASPGCLTMNRLHLSVSCERILPKLSADAALLVPAERNTKVAVL